MSYQVCFKSGCSEGVKDSLSDYIEQPVLSCRLSGGPFAPTLSRAKISWLPG